MLNPPQQEEVKWSGAAFKKMNNLRILVVRNVLFSINPTYLPNSLRWLEWEGYPSTTLPMGFFPQELIILKLPRSSFRLREPFKIFTGYVTHMDFSHCPFITEVPDVSQLRSLKSLKLAWCRNLIKVDDSVGYHSKLVQLDVSGCSKLSIFPREIKMPSLRRFHLRNCGSLEYFPRVVGNMDALKQIVMEESAIREIPPSIGNLSRLGSLSLYSCKSLGELPAVLFTLPNLYRLDLGLVRPSSRKSLMKLMQDIQPSISGYYNIKYLQLINCGLLEEELQLILSCFRNLRELYISKNDFVSLPKFIKQCAELRCLDVNNCKKLRDIPKLPSNLKKVDAGSCTSLTVESLDNLYSQAKKELTDLRITMPTANTKFPHWFNYCCKGDTLCFRARRSLPYAMFAFEFSKAINTTKVHSFPISMSINGRKVGLDDLDFSDRSIYVQAGHVLLVDLFTEVIRERKELNAFKGLDWNVVEIQITSGLPDIWIARCGFMCTRIKQA